MATVLTAGKDLMKLDDGHGASLDVVADEACKAKGIIPHQRVRWRTQRSRPPLSCQIFGVPRDQAGMEQAWIPRHKKGTAAIRSVPLGVADLVEPGGFEPPSASAPLSVLHA